MKPPYTTYKQVVLYRKELPDGTVIFKGDLDGLEIAVGDIFAAVRNSVTLRVKYKPKEQPK